MLTMNTCIRSTVKVLAVCGALASAGASARELNPTATPTGVTVTVVDTDVCMGVESNLRNNPRNIFANRRVYGVQWLMNSKGDFLSFNCWYTNMTQRVPQSIAVIYTASKETLDSAAREELENAQRALADKQKRIRDSGFE